MDDNFVNYSCADGLALSTNSVTVEYWSTLDPAFRATSFTSAIFTLFFLVVGLPSNLLIMVSILQQKLYTEPTYILLLNLSLVDFLMCLLVMPLTVVSGILGEYPYGSSDLVRCQWCKFGITFTMFGTMSLHILSLLSLDRFIFIKYPFKYYKIVTTMNVTVILVCLWAYVFVLSILPLFGFGDMVYQRSIATCTIRFYGETKLSQNVNYIITLGSSSLLPLAILLLSNVGIAIIVIKHIRRMYSLRNISKDEAKFMREVKDKLKRTKYQKQLQLFKVFGAIMVSALLPWIPLNIRGYLVVVEGSEYLNNWWNAVVFMCVLSFAVIHPIINASLMPEIRQYFFKVFKIFPCHDGHCVIADSFIYKCCGCSRWSLKDTGEEPKKHGCYCIDFLSITVLPVQQEFSSRECVA